jgi:hypothetical protein
VTAPLYFGRLSSASDCIGAPPCDNRRQRPGPEFESPGRASVEKARPRKEMRTLLTTCTLIGALLGPQLAEARAVEGRATQTDTGMLEVSSDPPAHVLIDDVDTKTVTPQAHLELKAGHHTLTLVTLDGGRKRTLGFNVEVGQTTRLAIHISP